MTRLAWLCAVTGTTLLAAAIAAIWLDVHLVEWGRRTISRFSLDYGRERPAYAFGVAFTLTFVISELIGHLFYPRGGDQSTVLPAVLGALSGVLVGVYAGNLLFPQAGTASP